MMRDLKIVFATDFHGSEVCFRKVFNLAERAAADAVVLGGDWTGKALLPMIRTKSGYRTELLGQVVQTSSEQELAELEKRVRFNGFYPFRCEQDEYDAMLASDDLRDELFTREMVHSVERWIDIAEDKLSGSERICVSLPGNDDEWAIDEALNKSTRVLNSDQTVIDAGDYRILGFGASNETPWKTPRELSEDDIYGRLTALAQGAEEPLIANLHVPPFRSTLDNAPQLTENLEIVKEAGVPVIVPVGSRGVRRFLEEAQPCLGLHGHIHESRSHAKLGDCFVLNPGSEYSSGVLRAAVITVDLKKRRVKGHQFVSG
jgi:Icc-related predicted phosphoesterase